MKNITILTFLSIMLLSVNSYADEISAGYESMNMNQTYKFHKTSPGYQGYELSNKAKLDIANIAYIKDINNIKLTTGLKFDITNNNGTFKIGYTDNTPPQLFKQSDADYTEVYIEGAKPHNDNVNFAIRANFNQFATRNNTINLKNKFKTVGLQATAEYHNTIDSQKKLSYSIKAGPVLERGSSKYAEHNSPETIKFNYLNFGYNFNPSISYKFSNNITLTAQYNTTKTKDLSLTKERWIGSEKVKVTKNTRVNDTLGINLSYKF